MSDERAFLDRMAPGLTDALRQAGIRVDAVLTDDSGVIVFAGYPLNAYWTLWDNGGEMGVLRVNDPSDRSVFFPFTGLRGQRLDAMTLLSRIWSAIHGEPIDYAFDYAAQCAAIDAARFAAGAA